MSRYNGFLKIQKRSSVNTKDWKRKGAIAGSKCSVGKQPPQKCDCGNDLITVLTIQSRVGATKFSNKAI